MVSYSRKHLFTIQKLIATHSWIDITTSGIEVLSAISACSALKFKDESAGLCCANGTVNIPDIVQPNEFLCAFNLIIFRIEIINNNVLVYYIQFLTKSEEKIFLDNFFAFSKCETPYQRFFLQETIDPTDL